MKVSRHLFAFRELPQTVTSSDNLRLNVACVYRSKLVRGDKRAKHKKSEQISSSPLTGNCRREQGESPDAGFAHLEKPLAHSQIVK